MMPLPIVQPPQQLIDILLPAFLPCESFQNGPCHACMTWDPPHGHVPRGFRGATGTIDEIKLVLVIAEPGDPYHNQNYSQPSALGKLLAAYKDSHHHIHSPLDLFANRMRVILDLAFDRLIGNLPAQLRLTWITESVLCSAQAEGAGVPGEVERECSKRYLCPQVELFKNRPPGQRPRFVTLGVKARRRIQKCDLQGLDVRHAIAAAPPGCNHPRARKSWEEALKGILY